MFLHNRSRTKMVPIRSPLVGFNRRFNNLYWTLDGISNYVQFLQSLRSYVFLPKLCELMRHNFTTFKSLSALFDCAIIHGFFNLQNMWMHSWQRSRILLYLHATRIIRSASLGLKYVIYSSIPHLIIVTIFVLRNNIDCMFVLGLKMIQQCKDLNACKNCIR